MRRIMKEQTTKERILEAAEELMLEKGFHSVGLKQILDAVKVPKGSFYHYFESKEQFGVEMLKHYLGAITVWKQRVLLSQETEPDPLKRLFTYLDNSIDRVQQTPGRFPCLALKLASELSELNEAMCREIATGFQDWIDIYQQVLDEAVAEKQLPETLDTASEAQFIQDFWSGAVKRAVVNHSEEPVRHAVTRIEERIDGLRT
jgi:TetR/AcrR family transcriptional repressor of nem operon